MDDNLMKTVKIIKSKTGQEVKVRIEAPNGIGEQILRLIAQDIQKMNRRRVRCGGERIGYSVELMSSSSS